MQSCVYRPYRTLLVSHKIPISEWMDFVVNLFSCQSFDSISMNNRTSSNTTRYKSGKVLLVLRRYQVMTILSGRIWLDNTYYTIVWSLEERKTDGLEYCGLFRNNYCIGVAITENMGVFLCRGDKGANHLPMPTMDSGIIIRLRMPIRFLMFVFCY